MSLLRPHYYWTEVRVRTTSNSQFPSAAPYTASVQATRNDDDEYVRSVWTAFISYVSDGTGGVPVWYGDADARLVISWDPENLGNPSDIGDDDPLTLGFDDLKLNYSVNPDDMRAVLRWELAPHLVTLRTARLGDGVGVKPAVLASLFYHDQNGYWAGAAEPANLRRLGITGRVLWASSSP